MNAAGASGFLFAGEAALRLILQEGIFSRQIATAGWLMINECYYYNLFFVKDVLAERKL